MALRCYSWVLAQLRTSHVDCIGAGNPKQTGLFETYLGQAWLCPSPIFSQPLKLLERSPYPGSAHKVNSCMAGRRIRHHWQRRPHGGNRRTNQGLRPDGWSTCVTREWKPPTKHRRAHCQESKQVNAPNRKGAPLKGVFWPFHRLGTTIRSHSRDWSISRYPQPGVVYPQNTSYKSVSWLLLCLLSFNSPPRPCLNQRFLEHTCPC